MVSVHEALLKQASVAVHVRAIPYVPAQVPWTVASINVNVTLASQASDTVGGVNTGTAGQTIGETWATQVIEGGVLSETLIIC